jgi:hypothetical protein
VPPAAEIAFRDCPAALPPVLYRTRKFWTPPPAWVAWLGEEDAAGAARAVGSEPARVKPTASPAQSRDRRMEPDLIVCLSSTGTASSVPN